MSNIKEMTVHEALSELKLLDRKFNTKLGNVVFAVANRHSNTKIDGQTTSDYVKSTDSSLQSLLDLLNYRKAIRNALSQSNAVTKITVAGKEYTVAEAIEMKKTGMELYRVLYNRMSNDFMTATRNAELHNKDLESKADMYVANMYGSRDKADISDAGVVREKYIEANTYEVVCMDDLKARTSVIMNDVDTFFSEVDAKISVSNALTTIKVEW